MTLSAASPADYRALKPQLQTAAQTACHCARRAEEEPAQTACWTPYRSMAEGLALRPSETDSGLVSRKLECRPGSKDCILLEGHFTSNFAQLCSAAEIEVVEGIWNRTANEQPKGGGGSKQDRDFFRNNAMRAADRFAEAAAYRFKEGATPDEVRREHRQNLRRE